MNDAPMRADPSTSRVGRLWLDLEPRRGTLFLINIGVPILIGVARGGPRSLDRRHYRPAPVLGRPRGSASEAPSPDPDGRRRDRRWRSARHLAQVVRGNL